MPAGENLGVEESTFCSTGFILGKKYIQTTPKWRSSYTYILLRLEFTPEELLQVFLAWNDFPRPWLDFSPEWVFSKPKLYPNSRLKEASRPQAVITWQTLKRRLFQFRLKLLPDRASRYIHVFFGAFCIFPLSDHSQMFERTSKGSYEQIHSWWSARHFYEIYRPSW